MQFHSTRTNKKHGQNLHLTINYIYLGPTTKLAYNNMRKIGHSRIVVSTVNYDSIVFEKLICKLESFGIQGKLLFWNDAFLGILLCKISRV